VATKFVVPYVKWGLKNPSTFILRISRDVGIDGRATGRLTASPASEAGIAKGPGAVQ